MTETETLEIIEDARKLIRAGWCQNVFARDMTGKHVNPENPYAMQFCLTGATERATRDWLDRRGFHATSMEEYCDTLDYHFMTCCEELYENFPAEWPAFSSLGGFNDHEDTTKDNVLELMDRTINSLKEN